MRALVAIAIVGLVGCRETVTTSPGSGAPAVVVPAPAAAIDAAAPAPPSSSDAPAAAPAAPSDARIDAPMDAGAAATPPDPRVCRADADCTVTNWPGCCACPQCQSAPPYAISKASLDLGQRACAVATCDMHVCDVAGMCPPGEPAAHFVARCRAGACVMVRR